MYRIDRIARELPFREQVEQAVCAMRGAILRADTSN
jgi:hypothetical protein